MQLTLRNSILLKTTECPSFQDSFKTEFERQNKNHTGRLYYNLSPFRLLAMTNIQNILITLFGLLLIGFTGCSFSSLGTRASYENKLNPKLNIVDTTFFLQIYGLPKERIGRNWQYYFEKIDNTYENKSTMPANFYEKDFEILTLTFNEKGIFIDWDLLIYH